MVSAMGGPNLALCVQGRIFYSLTGFAGTKKAIGDSMLKKKSKNKIGLERKTFLMVLFAILVFVLSTVPLIEAEENIQVKTRKILNTSKRFRIQGNLFVGSGTNHIDIGTTNDGETITLSGGGGLGASILVGYGLSSKLDIDLTAGSHVCKLSKKLSNADGSFQSVTLLSTLKYKIPVGNYQHVKFGAGLGFYMSGKWDVDTKNVPGGSHLIVEYDNATGFHITGEYEGMISSNWSWGLGLKYYIVTYNANSATQNGVSVPVNLLISEIRELDGGGVDFMISVSLYF